MLKRPALSVHLVAAVTVGSGLVGAVPAAGWTGGDPPRQRVVDVGDSIVITGETYGCGSSRTASVLVR